MIDVGRRAVVLAGAAVALTAVLGLSAVIARWSQAMRPVKMFHRPSELCASAHLWLITMSATGQTPTSLSARMHPRELAPRCRRTS